MKTVRTAAAVVIAAAVLVMAALRTKVHTTGEQWAGVDEAVIGRFVAAAGRKPTPVIDWVQGDLLLFAFLCAGLIAGFVLGFYGRGVFGQGAGSSKNDASIEH